MAKTRIFINVQGLDGMIDAMRNVATPSFLVTGKLEEALDQVAVTTNKRVHKISGRLRASQRTETEFDGKVWTGEILWGGDYVPPGYDRAADYARIELNRGGVKGDGTPHDWLSGLDTFDKSFESAIDSHFKALG